MHRDCAASPAFPGDSPPGELHATARAPMRKQEPSALLHRRDPSSKPTPPPSAHPPRVEPRFPPRCPLRSAILRHRKARPAAVNPPCRRSMLAPALRQHRQSEHLTRTLKKRRAHMPTICARHRGGGCTRFNAGGETPASFHAALTEPSCRWPPRQRRSSYEGWSGRRRPSERWRS